MSVSTRLRKVRQIEFLLLSKVLLEQVRKTLFKVGPLVAHSQDFQVKEVASLFSQENQEARSLHSDNAIESRKASQPRKPSEEDEAPRAKAVAG